MVERKEQNICCAKPRAGNCCVARSTGVSS